MAEPVQKLLTSISNDHHFSNRMVLLAPGRALVVQQLVAVSALPVQEVAREFVSEALPAA